MKILTRLVAWFRDGYPDGLPTGDYIALFGVLHRNLTASEIDRVVRALREDPAYVTTATIPETGIRATIAALFYEEASRHDVERVQTRLAAQDAPGTCPPAAS